MAYTLARKLTVTIRAHDRATAALDALMQRFVVGDFPPGIGGYVWTFNPSDRYTTAYSIWRTQRTRVNGQRGRGHHRPHRR